jgi:alpha-beta hydrolase superfamily lysophospholipase
MKKETKYSILAGLGALVAAYVALSPRVSKALYQKKVFKKDESDIEVYRQELLDEYAAAEKTQHFIETADGRKMHGYLFRHPRFSQQQDEFLIFYSVGRCSNISNCLDNVSMLIDAGWSVFIYEYRGFGISDEIEPSLQSIADDAVTAIQFVVHKLGYMLSQITAYGESLGGGPTTYVVNKLRGKLEGLILQSTFTALRDIGRDMIRALWIYPWFMHAHPRMENRAALANLKPDELPVHIITGAHDEVINKKHSMSLFKAAPQPKFLTVLARSQHRHIWLNDRKEFVNSMADFREYLAARRTKRGYPQPVEPRHSRNAVAALDNGKAGGTK